MKYLITGYKGQLGFDIKRELLKRGVSEEDILAVDKDEMDITKKDEVDKVVKSFNPNVIFHCAAWTAVDKAEDMKDIVYDINVNGAKNMTDAAIDVDATILYMSTDYVFDGTKKELYTEEDKVNPKSVYGETKYLGEEEVRRNPKHYITRISWVFGINGHNFVKTMLKLSEKHKELNVVNDQIGSPTYTVDLAKILVDMANTDKYGTYNVTNNGYCGWDEFANYIFESNGINDILVNGVTTEDYLKISGIKQAYRPRNSCLDKSKLEENFELLPSWKDAINRYNKELEEQKQLVKKI